VKVAWATCLPIKGLAHAQLLSQYPQITKIERYYPDRDFPQPDNDGFWPFQEIKATARVAELNEKFDLVAGIFPAQIIEAIRKYRIANYKKKGAKFAIWLMLAHASDNNGGSRWCVIG
jgi:hypothetical protein